VSALLPAPHKTASLPKYTHRQARLPFLPMRAALALACAAALLALGHPAAAAGKGIHLLNATQIDSLLSKPVPVPVPRNQTAVEKKATLFREVQEEGRGEGRGKRAHRPAAPPSLSLPQPLPFLLYVDRPLPRRRPPRTLFCPERGQSHPGQHPVRPGADKGGGGER